MMWLPVMHTFMGNRPKLAHWSTWVCIILRSCFCSLLTSNWEVSTRRFLYTLILLLKFHKNSWCFSIECSETNLPIGKHTLRVFTWYFDEIVGKTLFHCFIYVFVSILALPGTFNELCCGLLSCIHLWLTDQSWHTGPNESALHI